MKKDFTNQQPKVCLTIAGLDPSGGAGIIADIKTSNGTSLLDEGDVIQRINRQPVTDLKSFTEKVAGLRIGEPVVLHVLTYDPDTKTSTLKVLQFTVK